MAEQQYRTVVGIVAFDPKEVEANGKQARNIVLQQAGFKEQAVKVYVTIWPELGDVPIERGDALLVEGKYSRGSGTAQDGSPVTYHNISAYRIVPLGKAIESKRPDVENTPDADDGDIPF